LVTMIVGFCLSVYAEDRAVLIHNTIEEIDSCMGKLKLELVRVWGGDEEEDVKKFFRLPVSVAVSPEERIYICDQQSHNIRVFSNSGESLQVIGELGRGPGDLFSPFSIALSPKGDIIVYESGGSRIQCFSPEGKSKQIIKRKSPDIGWIAVTSKNEFAFYEHDKTLCSGKLISILDSKGEIIREIGIYHDKAKSYQESEKITFSLDGDDNIYAANKSTPLIRKYSPGGKLLLAITFELPFEIAPVEISLNSRGDEIKIVDSGEEPDKARVKKIGRGVSIQGVKRRGKPRVGVVGIGTDSKKRIYCVTRKRYPTEKEMSATAISGTQTRINRKRVDYNIVKNIDINRLLVFNHAGKVIAEAQLTTFCDGIQLSGNRIFIIDGLLNQRILEYRMSYEQ